MAEVDTNPDSRIQQAMEYLRQVNDIDSNNPNLAVLSIAEHAK